MWVDRLSTPPPFAPERIALFLDLDRAWDETPDRQGAATLSPIQAAMLSALVQRMRGRIAVLSSHTLAEVDRRFGNAVHAVAAVHGRVLRLPCNTIQRVSASPALGAAREVFAALTKAQRGLVLADKGVSVAIDYSKVPQVAEAICEAAERIAKSTELILEQSSTVAELTTPGPMKADALETLLRTSPFVRRIPIVVSDHPSDEDTFLAAASAGGYGVLVGPARTTRALYRLETFADAFAWLVRRPAPGKSPAEPRRHLNPQG